MINTNIKHAVQTNGLTKQYKTTLAVNNININVPVGCCCGFLGKNGAGKTTTIKMIAGLKKPTSGTVSIMGQAQVFAQGQRLPFGYLPDVPNFYGYMTGAEFLNFCAMLSGVDAKVRDAKVKALLTKVGLERTRTKISGYSRGMRQRLGIAQAMINDPSVILLDEPISALDPMGRRDVTEIIRSLTGTTVIMSTHILADVESICDYILIIEKGRIMAQDYLVNLKKAHAKDMAKLRFYNPEDGQKFCAAMTPRDNIILTQHDPLVFLLQAKTGDVPAMTLSAMEVLHQEGIAFERFTAHQPTLEDIFYEVVEGGVGSNV